jgi:hypothetical protein
MNADKEVEAVKISVLFFFALTVARRLKKKAQRSLLKK